MNLQYIICKRSSGSKALLETFNHMNRFNDAELWIHADMSKDCLNSFQHLISMLCAHLRHVSQRSKQVERVNLKCMTRTSPRISGVSEPLPRFPQWFQHLSPPLKVIQDLEFWHGRFWWWPWIERLGPKSKSRMRGQCQKPETEVA